MNSKIFFVLVPLLFFVVVPDANAHVAKVVVDYKIDAGWKHEPPRVNEENAIEIVITLATEFDKKRFDEIIPNIKGEPKEPSKSDLTGLAEKLEVDVKLGGEKTFVTLVESTELPGLYHGDLIPNAGGQATIHIYGIINDYEFEATFNPEKVEGESLQIDIPVEVEIPNWIRNNALWWSEGQIADSDFLSGIQFLIEKKIMKIPSTQPSETEPLPNVPNWVKDTAGWWANGQVTDDDFVNGIQYLVQKGIIIVS